MVPTTLDQRREAHLKHLFEIANDKVESMSEMVELRIKGDELEADRVLEYTEALKGTISSVSECYARTWLLGFARNILRHIPQELRDMIYHELIWLDNPNENYEDNTRRFNSAMTVSRFERSRSRTNALLSVNDYMHFFHVKYMGPEFAEELSMKFYSETRFTLQHPDEVKNFLHVDRFNSGCVPFEHIRAVVIDVSLDPIDLHTGHQRRWTSNKFYNPQKQHFVAAIKGLTALRRLRKTKKMPHTLLVRVTARSEAEDNDLPRFAELLAPIVYDLKSKGWDVQVKNKLATTDSDIERATAIFNYNVPQGDWTKRSDENSTFAKDADIEEKKRMRFW